MGQILEKRLKILVAGPTGLIGGRIAEYMSLKGHTVDLLSRNIRRSVCWPRHCKLFELEGNSEHSLPVLLDGYDVFINAVGLSQSESNSHIDKALEVNARLNSTFLDSCVLAGVRAYVYYSTVHVYNLKDKVSVDERSPPIERSMYSLTHLMSENMIMASRIRGDIRGYVVRLANGYGPPIDVNSNCWNLAVNEMCRMAVRDGQIILKNPFVRRDFIPISNICEKTELLLEKDLITPVSGPCGVVNFSSETSMSIGEMAEIIRGRAFQRLGLNVEIKMDSVDELNESNFFDGVKTIHPFEGARVGPGDHAREIDALLEFCSTNCVI